MISSINRVNKSIKKYGNGIKYDYDSSYAYADQNQSVRTNSKVNNK